jgi:hypothetical protein
MRLRSSSAISMLVFFCLTIPSSVAEEPVSSLLSIPGADSDRDGLSDRVEQSLLIQFAPRFMVSRQECSSLPAEFVPKLSDPLVRTENGTIYGQVFPVKARSSPFMAEVHFYHLWRSDCGAHSHSLDAEHVSVLVRASSTDIESATWRGVYWYAAAHEETLCDVSQIARATALDAEDKGAMVWISAGKHASFFSETLCARGCGADICRESTPLPISQIINLGEPDVPMNDAFWAKSTRWPLAEKMTTTNFPETAIARLSTVPLTGIALFNAGRHPMQGTIAISNATADALGNSGDSAAAAIVVTEASTGNAIRRSYDHTIHALGISLRRTGKALHLSAKRKSVQ